MKLIVAFNGFSVSFFQYALILITIFTLISISSEQFAWAQLLLELAPIPSSVQEGQEITFSGRISLEGQPLADQPIDIVNAITGQILDTTASDSNGEFILTWIAVPQDDVYLFYAEFTFPGAPVPVRSVPYEVVVTKTVGGETTDAIETGSDSPSEEDSGSINEISDLNSELVVGSDYVNPDVLLLIIIPIVAVVGYFIYKSKHHQTTRPSIEIRGGLD
ncbi:MAG: hypothetical protein WEC35_06195 [Nitrosopumilaceae archaeon]